MIGQIIMMPSMLMTSASASRQKHLITGPTRIHILKILVWLWYLLFCIGIISSKFPGVLCRLQTVKPRLFCPSCERINSTSKGLYIDLQTMRPHRACPNCESINLTHLNFKPQPLTPLFPCSEVPQRAFATLPQGRRGMLRVSRVRLPTLATGLMMNESSKQSMMLAILIGSISSLGPSRKIKPVLLSADRFGVWSARRFTKSSTGSGFHAASAGLHKFCSFSWSSVLSRFRDTEAVPGLPCRDVQKF